MKQTDLCEALGVAASSTKFLGSHKARMNACLRYFAEKGIPLATCADKRHLDRKLKTLKAYARELGLQFSDWTPLSMRPPKPPKAKRARKIVVDLAELEAS